MKKQKKNEIIGKEKKYGSYEIGQRIESFRKEKQITQEELANGLSNLLGKEISRVTVKGWETGHRAINSTHIVAIADFFQKTSDEILFGVKPANRNFSKYTGLSEKTIEGMHWFLTNFEIGEIYSIVINRLFDNDALYELMIYMISKKK